MKKLLFHILILGNLLPVQSQTFSKDQSSVIGKVFKQIREIKKFENYRAEDNILVESTTGTGFSKISDGSNTIILFTKHIEPSSNKILATLDIGKLEKNTQIVIAGCRVNKKNDSYIVALVKSTRGPYFKNIIKAWRIDVNTNRFVSIPTKGIDCLNDEEDAD